MQRLLLAAVATAVLSSHAWAWDGTNTGPGQLVEQGTANQNNPVAHSKSNATSSATGGRSSSTATGGRSSAYGGASTAAGGSGGAVSVNGLGGGGSAFLAVPSASAAGGIDCPVIGPGIGGQNGMAAGILSWGYISPDCNKRRTAMELYQLYGPEVARAYAERNIDGVADAVKAAGWGTSAPMTTKITEYPFDYCLTRNAGDKSQHRECDKRK